MNIRKAGSVLPSGFPEGEPHFTQSPAECESYGFRGEVVVSNGAFSFEITIESHAMVRNHTERSRVPFTQFPPMVTSLASHLKAPQPES